MRLQPLLLGLVISSLLFSTSEGQQSPASTRPTTDKCEVTKPNGIAAGIEEPARGSYGNRDVSAGPLDCGQMELSYSDPMVQVSSLEAARSE